jgi:hypothetical protein
VQGGVGEAWPRLADRSSCRLETSAGIWLLRYSRPTVPERAYRNVSLCRVRANAQCEGPRGVGAALRRGDDGLRVIGRVGSAAGALLAGLHHGRLERYQWQAGLRVRALEEGEQDAGAAWQGRRADAHGG